MEQLGGYLPVGAVGPISISSLIKKIYNLGPTPLVDIYYDLSYGRRPQVILIISEPGISSPILEVNSYIRVCMLIFMKKIVFFFNLFSKNNIRWSGPKAPPHQFKQEKYKLLNQLLDDFLPKELSFDQKNTEKEAITAFITEINRVSRKYKYLFIYYIILILVPSIRKKKTEKKDRHIDNVNIRTRGFGSL